MANASTDTVRSLCAELLEALEGYVDYSPVLDEVVEDEKRLIQRTRAALAQPEPQGPTDKQLLGCMLKAAALVPGGQCAGILNWDKEAITAARAVLARFGHLAIKPVPISDRLPGAQDCDAHGWCWVLYGHYATWTLEPPLDSNRQPCGWSHWLPATALPLPVDRGDQ